ncbi:Zinc finger protein 28 [Eumeta japonica]|uniref:Zinc finger protein 28 n=1 Tax=Eumeta variegata TaxID=151549 RepID=A0A4C1Z2C2_EUMVA|nr:Zinc finger protein 28 [Eumeta japonica]
MHVAEETVELSASDCTPDPFDDKLMCCLHCLALLDRALVSAHMATVHGMRAVRVKCYKCQQVFARREEMIEHRAICQRPTKRFKRKSVQQLLKELDRRQAEGGLLGADGEPVVACPVCMLQLPSEYLRAHLVGVHAGANAAECGLCGRHFKSRLTLREHMKLVHLAVDCSEKCDLCDQYFKSKKYLSNHKRNVHPKGDKIFKCEVCGKVFKSRLCLHQHGKYVHPPQSAAVGCPHCPKVFKSKINLHQHLKITHEGRRRRK